MTSAIRSCGSTSSAGSSSLAPVPSAGCSQPTNSPVPDGAPGRVGGVGHPAPHDREGRVVGAGDRQRGHHPEAVAPVVLAPGHVERALGDPGAAQDDRLADPGARERVVGAHHRGQRLGLHPGQVDGLGHAPGVPRVVLPEAERARGRDGARAPAGAPPSSAERAVRAPPQHTNGAARPRRRTSEPGRLRDRRHVVAHAERQVLGQHEPRRERRSRHGVPDPSRPRVAHAPHEPVAERRDRRWPATGH